MSSALPSTLPARGRVAVVVGKLLATASQTLGRGGGTALPGLVAERLDPALPARLARQPGAGRVTVTGHNGKATTARVLAEILHVAGPSPVHNRGGSNLMRALGATLIAA